MEYNVVATKGDENQTLIISDDDEDDDEIFSASIQTRNT